MVSIGTVWDRTVDFVRGNFGSLMPVVLATQFAPTVVTGSLERLRAGSGGVTALGVVLGLLTFVATVIALWVRCTSSPMPRSRGDAKRRRRRDASPPRVSCR